MGEEVVLKRGLSLFIQQCSALLKKNALLSWRNRRATFLQLVSSLFFIFLIFAVDQAIKAQTRDTTGFKNLFDPQPVAVTPIPPCEDGYFIKTDGDGCWDFFYTPNNNPQIETIVNNIKRKNPGRQIPDNKVKGFPSIEETEKYLLENPMRCPAAIHFDVRSDGVIAYGIQTNSTAKQIRGIYENANFKFQIPVQAAVERELTRFLTGSFAVRYEPEGEQPKEGKNGALDQLLESTLSAENKQIWRHLSPWNPSHLMILNVRLFNDH